MLNEANWDRIARAALGVVLLIVGFAVGGGLGVVIGVVALIPLVTGVVGWCPIYAVLGFRTNQADSETAG
ncbi:MAG: DUF2892 domain-containing protein [Microthrixaceae bacterium]